MSLFFTIVGTVVAIVIVAMFKFGGGTLTNVLFPSEPLQVGDQVEIFLDGAYNRTATITGVTADRIYIYDTLPLPLSYRGKFYAVGYDIDGVEFWYMKYRKRNNLVSLAEFIRERQKTLNDPYNLEPVTSESDLLTVAQKQKAESDKMAEETKDDAHES